jgi:hypothetical protein
MIVSSLLIYTAIFVPYKSCFLDSSNDYLYYLDMLIDVMFLIDIIVTFFSVTKMSDGQYITNRATIAKDYILGWFFIDVVTTFPF